MSLQCHQETPTGYALLECRYLNDVHSRYNKPVWLSEFSCPNQNGTLARQLKYARAAFKVLDEDNNTERSAPKLPLH